MRRTILVAAVGLCTLLTACGGSDDGGSKPAGSGAVGDAVRAGTGSASAVGVGDTRVQDGVMMGTPSQDDVQGLPEAGVGSKGGSCVTPPEDLGEEALGDVRSATMCLLNAERAARGLSALHLDSKLSDAAAGHSVDMVKRSYFAHDSPDGRSFDKRIKTAGYIRGARRWTIGENLAWGSGSRALPAQIVDSWMHSPPHRANILTGRFKDIGMGIVVGAPTGNGKPSLTYSTEFGGLG